MKEILAKDGLLGIYRGIIPTVTGMVPYAGLAFTTNDLLRKFVSKRPPIIGGTTPKDYAEQGRGRELGTYEKLLCGGVSGLVAQSAVYPLDVTRRRMQTAGGVKGAGGMMVRRNMWETLTGIYGEGGVRGLFKGLTMNWIKGPVAFSVSFTCFDYFKDAIERRGGEKEGERREARVLVRRGTGDKLDLTRGEDDETMVAVVFKDEDDEEEIIGLEKEGGGK